MFEFDNSGLSCANIHESYHPWTIEDAKAGDILATLDYIIIFKERLKNNGGVSYCHYDFNIQKFNYNEDNSWYFGKESKVTPASKEQRELLFTKMKEAGYEWIKDGLKLIKMRFKVGDHIVESDPNECDNGTIKEIKDGKYIFENGTFINIAEQDLWQLVGKEQKLISKIDIDKMVVDYQKKNKCSGSERRSYQQGILDAINTIDEK